MSGWRVSSFLARALDRRAAVGILGLAVALLPGSSSARKQAETGCDCEQVGITGGGVVRTDGGDVSVVIFASRLVGSDVPPAGVLRWTDPNIAGGLMLENDGSIVYGPVDGRPLEREVTGWATVNGAGVEPFRLRVTVRDDGVGTAGRCSLDAGDSLAGGGSGWSYSASGDLVGGDVVLLGDAPAPV